MNISEIVSTYISPLIVSSSVSTIIVCIFKKYIENRISSHFDRELEQFKNELIMEKDKEIENLKANLKRENDKYMSHLKNQYDISLEVIKSQLDIAKIETSSRRFTIYPALFEIILSAQDLAKEIYSDFPTDNNKYTKFIVKVEDYNDFLHLNGFQFIQDSIYEYLRSYKDMLFNFAKIIEQVSFYDKFREDQRFQDKKEELIRFFDQIEKERSKLLEIAQKKALI